MEWKEKRKLERFPLELPAEISLVPPEAEGEIEAKTSNICSGGAYIRTIRPLPVGTAVSLTLHLPLEKFDSIRDFCISSQIRITGKVSRCEQAGMSVLFDPEYQIHPHKS